LPNNPKRNESQSEREREDYELTGMVDAIQCARDGEPTQYEAPEAGGKMKALFVVGLTRISAGAKAVATALIWHANSKTGRCDPGIGRLGHETGLSRSGVIRALKELCRKGILVRTRRSNASNAYQLNWRGLAKTFIDFETVTVTGWHKRDQGSARNATPLVSETPPKPIKRTHEGNPCPERVSPNGATRVGSKKENEEGIQGEPVERPSPNANPRVEPNVRERLKVVGGTDLYSFLNSDAEDTASAEAAVEEDLRRHGEMYQRVLGWHELESNLAEAAASERREKGSGAKLILARFAERKATGT
jgi:DNA-binding Lrp family transcriptional regulator